MNGLARCLSASVHRPDDLAARVRGVELVVLLPDADVSGALRIARKVHEAVAALAVPSSGIGASGVTVSIDLVIGPDASRKSAEALYRAADAALYDAKAGGRNQTRCASGSAGRPGTDVGPLRLVSA